MITSVTKPAPAQREEARRRESVRARESKRESMCEFVKKKRERNLAKMLLKRSRSFFELFARQVRLSLPLPRLLKCLEFYHPV